MGRIMVTGATGGIGGAVVAELDQRGRQVIALGRDAGALERLAGDREGVRWIAADLGRPAGLAEAVGRLGELDGLIHAAGIAPVATVADSSYDLWLETLTVNVVAAAELTRLSLAGLRAARGHIVFVNAAPGLHAVPSWSAYVASKAALTELADSLRQEEADHGVRVTSVHPGGTATELLARVRADFGRPYDPDACIRAGTVASLIADLLDGDGAYPTHLVVRPS